MLQATGGTIVDHIFSTLRVIGDVNSSGPGTGSLIVAGGLSVGKDLYIKDDLVLPSGTISANNIRLTTNPVIGYTLMCSATDGSGTWEKTRDFRWNSEPSGISIHGYSVGIGVTNTSHGLSVSGAVQLFNNILLEAPQTQITYNQINFNTNTKLDSSGRISIGTSITEQLNLSGNLRVEGTLKNNGQTFTFPQLTDVLVGVSNTQSLSNKTIVSGTIATQLDANNFKIVNLGTPTLTGDATTKAYVDNLILGIDWKPSVLSKSLYNAPINPAINDSYLIPVGATGTFAGKDNTIGRYTASGWGYDTPTKGSAVLVEDQDAQWNYNGSEWVLFGTLVDHSNLIGLLVDTHTQYALLEGRSGGQKFIGGSAGSGSLTLLGNTSNNSVIFLGTTVGKVAINITNPTSNLHVRDSFAITDWTTTTTSGGYLNFANSTIRIDPLNSGNTAITVFGTTGYVGIGTSNPAEKLEVGGVSNARVKVKGTLSSGVNLSVTGDALIALGATKLSISNNVGPITISSSGVVIGSQASSPDAALVIGDRLLGSHSGLTTPSILLGTTGETITIRESSIKSTGHLVVQETGGFIGIGVTPPIEVLDVTGNIRLSGNLRKSGLTFTLPTVSDTLIGSTTTNTVYNKSLVDTSTRIINSADNSRRVLFDISGPASNATVTLAITGSGSNTIVFPDISDTIVTRNTSDLLTNKQLSDTSVTIVSGSKAIKFNVAGNANNSTCNILSIATTNMTVIIPDTAGQTDTIVTKNSTDILTNKTLVSPSVSGVCTFASDIIVQGNIYQNGTVAILDSTVLSIGDNMIRLGSSNTVPADIADIGIYTAYSPSLGVTSYTGMFRDATDKTYKFFDSLTIEPAQVIGITTGSFAFADVQMNTLRCNYINSPTELRINSGARFSNSGKLGINVIPASDLDVIGSVNFNNNISITDSGIGINRTNGAIANVDVVGTIRVDNSDSPGGTVLAGTVSTVGLSVTGTGTSFTTKVIVGDTISVGGEARIVTAVNNNTLLTVRDSMTTVSGAPITLFKSVLNVNNHIINVSGYTGLGTKFPAYPLEIAANTFSWAQKITNNNSIVYISNNSGEGINIDTGTLNNSSYALLCSNSSGTLLKVQANGKVGINTGSPSEILDIVGSNAGDGAQISNAKIGAWLGSNAYTNIIHSSLKATSTAFMIRQHSSGDTVVNAAATKSVSLSIENVPKLVLEQNGNVGIGIAGNANAKLHVGGGCQVNGDLLVNGGIYISGTSAELNVQSITIDDNLIKLADGNTTDIVDIGWFGQYANSGTKYAGFFRDYTDGVFKIFNGLTVEPGVTSISGPGYSDADLLVGSLTASKNVTIAGGLRVNYKTVTTNTTLTADHNVVLVNGAVTITIPRGRSVDSFTGISYTIINMSSNVVTINTSSIDLIDGSDTVVYLYSKYDRITLYNAGSDVSNANVGVWLVM